MVPTKSHRLAAGGESTGGGSSAAGGTAASCDRPPPGPTALREIARLYREIDGEVQALGVGCWAHGDCCDFRRFDHKLMASSLEISYVKEGHPERLESSSSLCPFWKAGKCTERERRPLGCRTFFCDKRYRQILEDLHEKYHRRLRQIAQDHACPWSYELFVDALCRPEDPRPRSGFIGRPRLEGGR